MRLQSCAMRNVYIRPGPVAGVFAITYAVVGLSAFVVYTVSSVQMFTLPIGIIIGIFHLNLNVQPTRSVMPFCAAEQSCLTLCAGGY
jgi:hypothetical protein